MKDLGWKAALVLSLSLAAWWALDVAFPAAPPDQADTMVIVGFMLAAVLGTSAVLKRVRKRPALAAATAGGARSGDVAAAGAAAGDSEAGDSKAGDAKAGDPKAVDADAGDAKAAATEAGDSKAGEADAGGAEAGDSAGEEEADGLEGVVEAVSGVVHAVSGVADAVRGAIGAVEKLT